MVLSERASIISQTLENFADIHIRHLSSGEISTTARVDKNCVVIESGSEGGLQTDLKANKKETERDATTISTL